MNTPRNDLPPPLVKRDESDLNSSHGNGPPPLIEMAYSKEIPALVDVETAVDVLVANLPSDSTVGTVSELLKIFAMNPIFVSPVEMAGRKYRYYFCHVWMQNSEEANKVENNINGLIFRGRKLVAINAKTALRM